MYYVWRIWVLGFPHHLPFVDESAGFDCRVFDGSNGVEFSGVKSSVVLFAFIAQFGRCMAIYMFDNIFFVCAVCVQ